MNINLHLFQALKSILRSQSFQKIRVQKNQQEPHIESVVAFIFKRPKKANISLKKQQSNSFQSMFQSLDELQKTEILFLQRVQKGSYSGDVCLPGGKVDQGQTLFQAVIRQTFEQTSIKLSQKHLIGVIGQRFTALKLKNFCLYTYAFVFAIDCKEAEVMINPHQMIAFKWTPFNYFLQENNYTVQQIDNSLQIKNLFPTISHIIYPAINVGLPRNLYGLTLYIVGYLVAKLIPILQRSQNKIKNVRLNQQIKIKQMSQIQTQHFNKSKALISLMLMYANRVKNHFFNEINLRYTNETLSEAQKSQIKKSFIQFVALHRAQRPKL